jgi:ribose/xylose/arabinose/galactoside ABC-type transport system permease subunit
MITQILINTPFWVYGLLIALILFGFLQAQSRTVKAVLAYFLPFGMIAFSLEGINSSFGIQPTSIAMWAIGLLLIASIGSKYFRDDRVTFNRSTRTFFIPGSWAPLFVIMAIFLTKYVFGVMKALDAEILNNPAFVATLSFAYGCFSGYFSSRAVNLMIKAKASTSNTTQPDSTNITSDV